MTIGPISGVRTGCPIRRTRRQHDRSELATPGVAQELSAWSHSSRPSVPFRDPIRRALGLGRLDAFHSDVVGVGMKKPPRSW
jgi:hypothetical protein